MNGDEEAPLLPMRDEGHLVRLMVEYQAGEIAAFEGLYDALAGDLARHFASQGSAPEAAADLVQDTFMEMHRSRHTYLRPLPVRPWVFGVARNVLRRHRRSAWRRARHEERGRTDAEAAAPGPGRIGRGELDEAVRSLPPGRRRAWLLHHVHGFSFAEIAALLRIPEGAAKLRSSRAMAAVRAFLGVRRRPGRD